MMEMLNPPYGGMLIDLRERGEKHGSIRFSSGLPTVRLSSIQLQELAALATGMLSPLDRYLDREALTTVLEHARLPNGAIFPYPLVLDVATTEGMRPGDAVVLRNLKNNPVAWMTIEQIFELPQRQELGSRHRFAISGQPRVIELPRSIEFPRFRKTPAELRGELRHSGYSNLVAFGFRGPLSVKDERELVDIATRLNAAVIAYPSWDNPALFDADRFLQTRICAATFERCIRRRGQVLLQPVLNHLYSVRDILLELVIQRNYGATHLLMDPAELDGMPKARQAAEELDVELIPSTVARRRDSGSLASQNLHPETRMLLQQTYPERARQGFCIWLTGLPSAGKSTIAELVAAALLEQGRQITVLDGDVVRTHLSQGLGFTREDRDLNVLRIGFVASEIVRHNGAVICAAVSPYKETRNKVRDLIGQERFIEVFVNTPLSVCEARDAKGYYAQARAGELASFTGVSDPYEPPDRCELVLHSAKQSPEECAAEVIRFLRIEGFLAAEARAVSAS